MAMLSKLKCLVLSIGTPVVAYDSQFSFGHGMEHNSVGPYDTKMNNSVDNAERKTLPRLPLLFFEDFVEWVDEKEWISMGGKVSGEDSFKDLSSKFWNQDALGCLMDKKNQAWKGKKCGCFMSGKNVKKCTARMHLIKDGHSIEKSMVNLVHVPYCGSGSVDWRLFSGCGVRIRDGRSIAYWYSPTSEQATECLRDFAQELNEEVRRTDLETMTS